MDLKTIEFWEHEYLEQIYYLLTIDQQKMLNGFNTKEDIRNDWEEFLGKETSDFATGSERIFYWLFSQFGIPNSSPIGSDMFFETYNAYIHIDIKTVTKKNIGDFKKDIFVGNNQNSYKGKINVQNGEIREYKGNLPSFYTKNDGSKKICLTYFIAILYNETNLKIQAIIISCMPNGELSNIYELEDINKSLVLKAGKNKDKVRFKYIECNEFRLLNDETHTHPLRTKVLVLNPDDEKTEKDLENLREIYNKQKDLEK